MAEPTTDESAGKLLVKALLMVERRREAAEKESRAPAGLTPGQSREIFGK